MPATKVDYVSQPFVREPYRDSGYGRTLADLMLQRGNQAAALHLQRGDDQARMWQQAGGAVMGAVQDWTQRTELQRQQQIENAREDRRAKAEGMQMEAATLSLDKAKRADKAEQFTRQILPLARRQDGLNTYDRDVLAREFESAGMADQLPQVFAALDEQEGAHLELLGKRRDVVASDALRVLQSGGDEESYAGLLEYWEANDVLPARELKAMKKLGKDPEQRQRALMAAVQSSPRGLQALKTLQDATAPKLHNVPEGAAVIDERNPQAGPIYTAPRAEKPPTSIEDAILQAESAGDTATVQRLLGMKKEIAAAGRAPAQPRASEPLETVIGPDGKAVMVPRSEAVGKQPANVREQTSTGAQKRVFQFFQRAQQAEGDVANVEDEIAGMGLSEQAWLKMAPNFLQTDKGQLYNQAQRAFTEARLRKDSGAAIPPHEYEADRKTYFAEPGDSPETLEQKRRARANVLSALAFESGRAVSEFYGDEADGLLSSLKARAGGAKAKGGADGWEVIDGIRVRVKP